MTRTKSNKTKQNKTLEQQILSLIGQFPDAAIPTRLLENVLHLNSKKGKSKLTRTLKQMMHKGVIQVNNGLVSPTGKAAKRAAATSTSAEGKAANSTPSGDKSAKAKAGKAKKAKGRPAEAESSGEATIAETPSAGSGKSTTKGRSRAKDADRDGQGGDDGALIGILDVTSRGDGYVMIEGRETDIRISARSMGTALHGDRVEVTLIGRDRRRDREMGRIDRIVERTDRLFVGTLLQTGHGHYIIEPDQRSAHVDFLVREEDLNGAEPESKVSFRLAEWTHARAMPRAADLRVLGKAGSSGAEILSILAEKQFHAAFPPAVEAFAAEIPDQIPDQVIAARLDLRDRVTFTIDPLDAKDFDDALSIRRLENGNHELGVHIADVTHYMPRGSVLDKEAYARATSVYLVDRVIPMLPERLSNGVCSLRPNEDKLTFSCMMEITPDGKLVDHTIVETVIHSGQRFVYDEVQQVLDGQAGHRFEPELRQLQGLAETLMKNRFEAGSINFETPEPRFILDETGRPVDVIVKERLFAHRLIEECMLMANKTVALHIEELRTQTRKRHPFFYRVHDRPDSEKLEAVLQNVRPLGIHVPSAEKLKPRQINDLLKQVEGTHVETLVNDLMLRAMAKAVYGPENIGHFGLAFSHYAHFTSPIRRYPDVIVHRLLKSYAAGSRTYSLQDLEGAGRHCSMQERNATEAERDSVKLKQVEFLSERIGEAYDGVISGVTEHGFYVQLRDIYCEGMVRMSELKDDYYVYTPQMHALVARGRRKQFQLGQDVRVRVLSTDTKRRHIDLGLA